jgi:hypothetical protein
MSEIEIRLSENAGRADGLTIYMPRDTPPEEAWAGIAEAVATVRPGGLVKIIIAPAEVLPDA